MLGARQTGVWAIRAVHIAFVLYVVANPYIHKDTNDLSDPFRRCFGLDAYSVIYLAVCAALLVHWWFHSDICILSKMEELVSGKSYNQGFIHRLVSPIYNLPNQGEMIRFLSYAVVLFNATLVYRAKK